MVVGHILKVAALRRSAGAFMATTVLPRRKVKPQGTVTLFAPTSVGTARTVTFALADTPERRNRAYDTKVLLILYLDEPRDSANNARNHLLPCWYAGERSRSSTR
jgi:hypothetical protein